MPELPEVETIRRGLESAVLGARIEDVVQKPCRVFRCTSEELFGIRGQHLQRLLRRGKYLIAELENSYVVFHLGMTGQLTVRDPAREDASRFIRHETTGLQRAHQHAPDRHTHLEILLGDGREILYRDIRMFGKIHVLARNAGVLESFLGHLGLEPFSSEYTLEAFLEKFRNRKVRVKPFLLDQSVVAGVGNIYADEALFLAGIHPMRPVRGLRKYEKVRLFETILKTLEAGIQFGGTSMSDFVNSEGRQGSNQEKLNVYARDGQPCTICATPIQKIVVSQRGTHFCPGCQPRSRPSRIVRRSRTRYRRDPS